MADSDRKEDARRAHLQSYYDGLLQTRKYAPFNQQALKRRVFDTFDALLRHRGKPGLVAGSTLLDLGSADGAFVAVARAAGVDAKGLDITDGLDFEIHALPIESSSVDVVTAVSLIEHLSTSANMLREIHRVLKPGGSFICVTPNWKYSASSFYDDPTHVRPFTPTSLAKLLKSYAYQDVYVVPWLVKKPTRMWDLPYAFAFARWAIPFRGDAPAWIPSALKGRSASILSLASKN